MDKQYFLDKLTKNRPSVFETNNYDLLPAEFKAHDKIAVQCYKHGVFYQKAGQHLFGQGCPTCGRLKSEENRCLTTEAFIDKSRSKFGEKFKYHKTKYIKKGIDLTVTCPSHGDIVIKPEWHTWSSHGCPKCDYEIPRSIKRRKVIEAAKLKHGNKYDYKKVVYANVTEPVEIICPNHGPFWQALFIHVNAAIGCPSCAREADRLTLEDFIKRARVLHGDRYDYGKSKLEGVSSVLTITCKKHGDFRQRAHSHLKGCRCKKCFIEDSWISTEEFIRNAKEVHGNDYDYSKVKYIGSKRPVEIVCSKHGSFWLKPNSHVSSRAGCKFCCESKGEKAVEVFLKKYGIEHIREFRIMPSLYRYDFYLPVLDIFIEFNGIQHYTPVDTFGGLEAYLKVKENDEAKRILVKQNRGFLIVISHKALSRNSVEKELISELKMLYSYWFVVDGKIKVYRKSNEVYSEFDIPDSVKIKDLEFEVTERFKNVTSLF